MFHGSDPHRDPYTRLDRVLRRRAPVYMKMCVCVGGGLLNKEHFKFLKLNSKGALMIQKLRSDQV